MIKYVQIKILGKFNWQTYPIVEGMIKVKQSDLDEIGISKCFDVENQCIIDWTPESEQD